MSPPVLSIQLLNRGLLCRHATGIGAGCRPRLYARHTGRRKLCEHDAFKNELRAAADGEQPFATRGTVLQRSVTYRDVAWRKWEKPFSARAGRRRTANH